MLKSPLTRSSGGSPAMVRGARKAFAASLLLLLGACGAGSGLDPLARQEPPAAPAADVIGSGSVKVALVLPLSAPAGAGQAQALRNAAEMAMAEFQSPDLQIIVKDDKGTAEGAQIAAREALAAGAELMIGPLFAPSVAAAGEVWRPTGRPVIGFSTDTNVAQRGTYLLSFTPQSDVDRVIRYAASRGKKSFSAMIPNTAYGNVVADAFQQAVTSAGGRIVSVERYAPGPGVAQAAQRIAAGASQIDSLFLPEAADQVGAAVQALSAAGVSAPRVQFLGTGIWSDPRVYRIAGLNGAWFPAPDTGGYAAFSQRYRTRFKSEPTVIAPNAYDAVALAAALVRTQGANRFREQVITNPSGFAGQYGVFRFRSDGTSERALAIQQIGNGTTQAVSPAPRSFTSGT